MSSTPLFDSIAQCRDQADVPSTTPVPARAVVTPGADLADVRARPSG
ncbi:hypothetical protein Q9Q99_16690 [Curtobacterium flaccumfaciens]|nr:hypothetical protein Q9Q99_16690 [Curtobacterium flaccumfaciens]